MQTDRRSFLKTTGMATAVTLIAPNLLANAAPKKPFFQISLAEWSLHKELFAKTITNLDFPGVAKKEFGISIVEYVNQFFKDKANDTAYLNDLLTRCKDNGVSNHLIMIDEEGPLAETDATKQNKAIDDHKKWVECAKYLGCKTIRVNAYGNPKATADDTAKAATVGLSKLGEFANPLGINIIVENHGGLTSNGQWLAGVMKTVNMKNVGTLPDFGNFCIKRNTADWRICEDQYDRYQGVGELMPFAKGASAKTYDFDEQGNCIETDYNKTLKIVKDSGFRGIIGIEYEGDKISERDGIKRTKALLERVGGLV